MWPFRKKPVAASGDAIQEQTICPLCFSRFPAGTFNADYAFCPSCSSEGMDSGVESLAVFLATKTPEDLDEIAARWQAAEGFIPQYIALKMDRIAQLKALKLNARY